MKIEDCQSENSQLEFVSQIHRLQTKVYHLKNKDAIQGTLVNPCSIKL